ncbi:hypothetical protein Rhopal_004004-T1 [Rhodotorula paludigena]|uniref:Proteophosphoglycan ppg4 n=1 Tax=Rhodotorula paludigena TaxID=86838 RepID=A0AAV5GN95_9BASI|nr:hypothetical protein Rhopal_004004-T1 [Rhodotorula paludigena]
MSNSTDTLAMRRMRRPPLFRRRSKSLDDVDTEEVDGMLDELLDERARGQQHLRSGAKPTPKVVTATAQVLDDVPLSAKSLASLADSQGTSVPPSATSSTLSTLADGSEAAGATSTAARMAAEDDRLANWVRTASFSSAGSAPSRAPRPPATPGRLPLPPRQPYTPVLPSPLSTCSYTSADDERDGGFPFPPTPHRDVFKPSTTSISERTSPDLPLKDLPPLAPRPEAGSGALGLARPGYTSYSSQSTLSSTATATPLAAPDFPSVARAHRSPTLIRSTTEPIPGSSSASPAQSPAAASPAPSSASGPATSVSAAIAATRARAHTRGASASSFSTTPSHSSASGRHAIPLTPPESLCTAPWQAGASAAELAWHDVLQAKFGASAAAAAVAEPGAKGSAGGIAMPPAAVAAMGSSRSVRARADTGSWGGGPSTGTTGGGVPSGGAGGDGAGAGGGATGRKAGWQGNELMGAAAAGGYAASTKQEMEKLLSEFLPGVPLGEQEETVNVVEYGALNSRSISLVPRILAHFAEREAAFPGRAPTAGPDPDELLSFQVTHVDKPAADFRCLTSTLETSPESYMRKFVGSADLALDGRVFSAFAARPDGVKVLPKKSVSVGFSAMSLHWPSTDRKYRVAPATLAHGELMAFLSARASEFKPGGLLTVAYMARSEEAALAASSPSGFSPSGMSASSAPSSPADGTSTSKGRRSSIPTDVAHPKDPSNSPPPPIGSSTAPPVSVPSPPGGVQLRHKDIWAHLTSILGKAIQRLVSTGLLKPQIARVLLALPLHPRTPRQTQACLRASAHSWDVLKSEIVVLSHPAWKGVEHGTVSVENWADHTIQLLKIFWEDEMRSILRDTLGSRGACEWVLDCLWTVAKEKVEDLPPHPLELEVQFIALRRRERPASVPASPVEGVPFGGHGGAGPVSVAQALGAVVEEQEKERGDKENGLPPPVGAA